MQLRWTQQVYFEKQKLTFGPAIVALYNIKATIYCEVNLQSKSFKTFDQPHVYIYLYRF